MEEKSSSALISPLKAAADLIQTLDLAYSEMTNCAADAARDAEEARRNARTASEIARRYLHRSYPKVQSTFGGSPSPKMEQKMGHFLEATHAESKEESNGYGLESSLAITKRNSDDPLHDINGIKPPTPTSRVPTRHSVLSSSPSRNRARNYHAHSSVDRIAQSHAEDVLTLSMELERSRQAYQSEQRMHDETKAALSMQKVKANNFEQENKKLKEKFELLERENNQKIQALEEELTKSKYFVKAAEEDAQLALDLAKDSSDKRDAMEEQLRRTLEELRHFKEQPPPQIETPRRYVRFADDSPVEDDMVLATPPTPSRSMVATGRQLLRRSHTASPGDEVITLELTPAKSAERRRRFRDRLTQLEDSTPLALLPSIPAKSPQRSAMEPEDCRNAAKLLQESGRRLELAGHWWRKGHANPAPLNEMEAMTRQYCQSVEFKVERQQKDINELESLCGFLERKLVTGTAES